MSDRVIGTNWRTESYRHGFDVALSCIRDRAAALRPEGGA